MFSKNKEINTSNYDKVIDNNYIDNNDNNYDYDDCCDACKIVYDDYENCSSN